MKRYNPSDIEPKWQARWAEDNRYRAVDDSTLPRYYISCMFPYPSGAGMHVGHAFEHSIVDTLARFHRAQGMNVLNPMGWDAFGLPAENYAIKTGIAPAIVTKQNIANFTTQLKRIGASIDWSREINTSDPEYYKWTQWVFTQFYKRGLAYQKYAYQWWCDQDQTVLANEQVINGACWRCDQTVVKRPMHQWFFKITDYADRLLEATSALDWPEKIKAAQENWIGKSVGAEITFSTETGRDITVFTTRPDTIFGATALVLAPEYEGLVDLASSECRESVEQYASSALKRSEIERMSEGKEKTGVFTGIYALNPATGERVPVWVADYVLGGYGTGAIMAVPAHDERDFAFATQYCIPIRRAFTNENDEECVTGEGVLVDAGQFSGLSTSDARENIVAWLEQQGVGRAKTSYKIRDWLISRQRYWGAPIPIVHVQGREPIAVHESCLPVELPHVDDYAPKGNGSVLAQVDEWVRVWVNVETGETAPITNDKPEGDAWVEGRRETDTMDGYACSSWYLLRYIDPNKSDAPWSREQADRWMPVDTYVGGDHAVAHLLYVRFWSYVFHDMGLLAQTEPVKKLIYHGLILAEDGSKMSKSKGNVVDPIDVIDQGYGADSLRTLLLFLGPINDNARWSSAGVAGVYRFLNRVWTLTQEYLEAEYTTTFNAEITRVQHATIKKVTHDIHTQSFNTAIAALMEYVNVLYKYKAQDGYTHEWKTPIETLIQLLSPIAPHMTAELWEQLGNDSSLDTTPWCTWDESALVSVEITVVVQINGKVRATLTVPRDIDQEGVMHHARREANVQKHLEDAAIKKVIYIPGKILNIVI